MIYLLNLDKLGGFQVRAQGLATGLQAVALVQQEIRPSGLQRQTGHLLDLDKVGGFQARGSRNIRTWGMEAQGVAHQGV